MTWRRRRRKKKYFPLPPFLFQSRMKMLRPTGGRGGKSACWTWREIWIDIWVVGFWRQLFNQRRRCSFFFFSFLFFLFIYYLLLFQLSLSLSSSMICIHRDDGLPDWTGLGGTCLAFLRDALEIYLGDAFIRWSRFEKLIDSFYFFVFFVVFPTLFFSVRLSNIIIISNKTR